MMEMINYYINGFVAKMMAYGYTAVHFLLCSLIVVAGLILVIRFAKTWLQRGVIVAVCAVLLAVAPYLCRKVLLPFFGTLLSSVLTVSTYIIIAIGPLLLLVLFVWKSFTKHL